MNNLIEYFRDELRFFSSAFMARIESAIVSVADKNIFKTGLTVVVFTVFAVLLNTSQAGAALVVLAIFLEWVQNWCLTRSKELKHIANLGRIATVKKYGSSWSYRFGDQVDTKAYSATMQAERESFRIVYSTQYQLRAKELLRVKPSLVHWEWTLALLGTTTWGFAPTTWPCIFNWQC